MPEKEKRKNDEDVRKLGQNLWRYGVVVPLKGIWRYGIVMPTQGAWRATKAIFRWSWQATKATARWSWMALKWTVQSPFKWAWQATLWTLNLPLRIFDWLFGIHPPEHLSDSQKAAYVRIKRYYRRRNRLIAHSFFYGMGWVVTLAQIYSLWQRSQAYGIDLSSGIGATMAFISVWTLMIAFHYIRVRMSDSEDTALAQVLEHGGGQDYRRKRGDLVYHEIYDDEAEIYADEIAYRHLTDDGEFADDAPYYTDEQANRRRRE